MYEALRMNCKNYLEQNATWLVFFSFLKDADLFWCLSTYLHV